MEHDMLRRFGCALCALAFALTALPTAAFAQQPEEQAAVQQSLRPQMCAKCSRQMLL